MPPAALSSLLKLPPRQRLEIAERLWVSVADEAQMPVPAAHKRIVRKRLADYRAGRVKAISHAELMQRIRSA